jgi:hypothetical protein
VFLRRLWWLLDRRLNGLGGRRIRNPVALRFLVALVVNQLASPPR